MWVIFVVRGRVIRTRGVSAEDFTELREIMGSGRMASVMSYCADNYDIGIADVSTAGFWIEIKKFQSFGVPIRIKDKRMVDRR